MTAVGIWMAGWPYAAARGDGPDKTQRNASRAEVGEPSPQERAEAEAIAQRIAARRTSQAS